MCWFMSKHKGLKRLASTSGMAAAGGRSPCDFEKQLIPESMRNIAFRCRDSMQPVTRNAHFTALKYEWKQGLTAPAGACWGPQKQFPGGAGLRWDLEGKHLF
eukprot:1159421-Pelagomonas_calceolata.AAC.14